VRLCDRYYPPAISGQAWKEHALAESGAAQARSVAEHGLRIAGPLKTAMIWREKAKVTCFLSQRFARGRTV
jgi:hypothetical protein